MVSISAILFPALLISLLLNLYLYCFFYLLRPAIKDYFLPGPAPHKRDPKPVLEAISWLHILLGFWMVIPLLTGVALMRWRNQLMWKVLIGELVFLVLLFFLSFFQYGSALTSLVKILGFVLASQGLLYVTRKEVRAAF